MNNEFTSKIIKWLDTPESERDYEQGALYVLQLSNNRILYHNISRDPRKHADIIEYNIRKYAKFRLEAVTHAEVVRMQSTVDSIVSLRSLDKETQPSEPESFKSGKRQDHDSLPSHIQALYAENATLMHKMRELHMRLRSLSLENATCPDSERYPFLKELIDLDRQYRSNWRLYDSWSASKAAEGAEQTLITDQRLEQKNLYRQINLVKGRYRKNPSEKLRQQLVALYSKIASPVETLTAELLALGIITAEPATVPEESSSAEK